LIKQGKLEDADFVLRGAHKVAPKDSLVTNDLFNLSLQRSRKFLASKDVESASKAAREALYLNPSSSTATNLLNQVLRKSGVNPLDSAARLKLGDQLAGQGRDTAALVEYRASLRLQPSANAHVGLGNMLLRSGQKSKAKDEYQLALETDPNSSAAHRQIGLLKLSSGDTIGANTDLSRAVILDPKDKIAGKALTELWQKQVAKHPDDANSRLGLARAYQITGDLQSAHSEYRQVVRIDPNHPNLPACRQSFKLALARQEAGRHIDAAHTLESQGALADAHGKVSEALAVCPTDPGYRMYQGQLLEKLGQYQQAHDAYLGVLKSDPNNVLAAQRLNGLPSLLTTPLAAPVLPLTGPAAASGAGSLGPFVEQPPAPTIPTAPQLAPSALPPSDHVSTLSTFLSQLRDQSLTQQKLDQATERKAADTLDRALQPPSAVGGGASSLVAAGLTGLAGTAAAGLAGASNSSDFNPPVVVMPPLPNISTPVAASSQAATSPVPVTVPQGQTHQLSTLASAAPTTQAMDPLTYQRLLFAEQQNKALSQQLQQTQQTLQQYQQTAIGSPSDVNNIAPPSPLPAGAPAFGPPQSYVPPPANPQGYPIQALSPNAMPPVRFELESVSHSNKGVQLKVVLKNDQNVPLPIAPSMTGIVRSLGAPDSMVKVSFHDKQVPAHGKIRGTVKIPTQQISPTADLFLPNLLPPASMQRDVHLTAVMSPQS
jgi:tetratricopeptide (TPR) repeat protein